MQPHRTWAQMKPTKLLPLLLFWALPAHAVIPPADAQWSVNEQGRSGDTCFFEHVNDTLEDCTNTIGVDTSNAIDGINFDGDNDYVEVGSLPTGLASDFIDGDYTLAVRVEPDDSTISGFQHIFGVFAAGTDDARYQIYKSEFSGSGGYVAAHNDNGGSTDAFIESSDNGTDEAVVVLRRDGNEFSLWIDGTEVDTDTVAVGTHGLSWNRFGFGARTDGNLTTSPRYFDGTILWAAAWDTALTDSEIQELDDSAMPFPTSSGESLDDDTPAVGTTFTLTTISAPGGTLTTAEITIDTEVDTTSCEAGATTTTCDVFLDPEKFSIAGDLNNMQLEVAGTIRVRDDSLNWTTPTAITIDIPSNGAIVDLNCTAGSDCETGSEAESPMGVGDDCAIIPVSALSVVALTEDCQPYFSAGSGRYYVLQFDESANRYLQINDFTFDEGGPGPGPSVGSTAGQDIRYSPKRGLR